MSSLLSSFFSSLIFDFGVLHLKTNGALILKALTSLSHISSPKSRRPIESNQSGID